MEWWPSATLLSPCIIDVTYFPFDYQECTLTIGPWGYHSEQVSDMVILITLCHSGCIVIRLSLQKVISDHQLINCEY